MAINLTLLQIKKPLPNEGRTYIRVTTQIDTDNYITISSLQIYRYLPLVATLIFTIRTPE
jgi:hypothetical protein